MFTATLKKKTNEGGAIRVEVEFSNGTISIIESCIPQDKDGFRYWVKSRLATFNGGEEINSTIAVNDPIDTSDPVVTQPTPTAQEIAKTEWQADWKSLQNAVKLEAHGVFVLSPTQMTTLKSKVQDNFLNSYKDVV